MGIIPLTILRTSLALLVVSSGFSIGQPASGAEADQAQSPASQRVFKDIRPAGESLILQASQGTVLQLPGDARTLFVADSEVADVQLSPPDMVLVTARKAGATALYALDGVGNILLNRFIEVRGAVTVIRGVRVDTGAPPPGPLVLQIPLQPAVPAPSQK
jgi:Flp pilus assembly secretin CpaC